MTDSNASRVAATSLEDALRSRRSVRVFTDQMPTRERIEALLSLAILAPSASNKQPWRFSVVRHRETLERMASAVQERVDFLCANMDSDGIDAFRTYGDYFTRFAQAPCVIAIAFRASPILSHLLTDGLPAHERSLAQTMEHQSACIGASLALQNLLLAAPSLGLGASALTGPLIAADLLKPLVRVTPSWNLLALVSVGYPAETPNVTQRKPVEQSIRWIDGDHEHD
ncbi:MAG: nitroreductase family protein [Deltaproteobacteria bacterium]|nr:nitroreductase family protein [Deltaproteobacteria bacterium]